MKSAMSLNRHFLPRAWCMVWPAFVLAVVPLPAQMSSADNSPSFSNFQNAPVSSILDTYEQLSGVHLVRDVSLGGLPPITLNASNVGKEEFLRLMEATLLLNGVAIVPVDDHTAKVVSVASNKNPRSEGVRLYANADDIPQDDQVVSYYMPLTYISPN
jgi:general secretion pathway protein D